MQLILLKQILIGCAYQSERALTDETCHVVEHKSLTQLNFCNQQEAQHQGFIRQILVRNVGSEAVHVSLPPSVTWVVVSDACNRLKQQSADFPGCVCVKRASGERLSKLTEQKAGSPHGSVLLWCSSWSGNQTARWTSQKINKKNPKTNLQMSSDRAAF